MADVLIERVHDKHGDPATTVATGGGDDGLWRVISARDGARLVVGESQAMSIAQHLLTRSAGTLQIRRHLGGLNSAPSHREEPRGGKAPDPGEPPDRRRNSPLPAAERRSPGAAAPPGDTQRQRHQAARRTQSNRGERGSR